MRMSYAVFCLKKKTHEVILFFFFFLMIRRPTTTTRTYTPLPYTTLFRSFTPFPTKSLPSFLGRFSRHWQRAPLHRHHPRQLSARLRYPRWRGGARDRLGKNRGIGAATARVLGQADARVMLADISGRQVEQTAATLAGEGYDIAWQTIDLSDESTAKPQ